MDAVLENRIKGYTEMNYRSAKYNRLGTIDCEIEHPTHGWIPFTCDPNDQGAAFDTREMFDRMVDSGVVAAYVPPTQEELVELQWAIMRDKRDALLRESDILVLPDRWMNYTLEQQQALAAYRQTLRDLPETTTDPLNPVWPELPDL